MSSTTFGEGPAAALVSRTRDAAGRPQSASTPRGTFTYTGDGHLDMLATPEGATTHFSFDGPLLEEVSTSGPVPGETIFTYDDDVRLAGDTVNGSSISYAYDDDDLLLSAGELAFIRDPSSGLVTG